MTAAACGASAKGDAFRFCLASNSIESGELAQKNAGEKRLQGFTEVPAHKVKIQS
jgi:hypothetical protein